ncbi:ras guanine nucleotide exchange factor domain-containing protein [Chytridium lagenaria]|nr:ras guanine nucleotide exchange factor domain-containing protein [Chytridium lagenaria]
MGDPDAEFFKSLEEHLKKFEVEALEVTGLSLDVNVFPAPIKPLLREAQEDKWEKLASGVWPPPLAEREMLESCYPCVLAVKKLFSLTKEAANKIRRVWAEDVKKKEEWNRKRLQNEKVKALFQVWQGQDETAVLRGGRLAKMVEYMTSHLGLDQDLMASFLLTHHSFTTSLELLNCFIRRYESVIAVLRYWLKTHFEEDFGMNELLLRNLRGFVARVIVLDWELLGKDMLELIDHQVQQLQSSQKKERRKSSIPLVQDESQPQSFFSKSTVPKPILPKSFQPTSTDLILTLIEFEDFKKVKPYECLAQIWASKLNKEREAARIKGGMKSNAKAHVDGSDPDSNIMKMIKHTNLISSWVATCIVSNDNLKTRIAALKYFAQCALKCWEVNNFNGITGIVAHFAEKHSSIYDEYEQAADIVSPKGQYASYRKELKDLKPPAIPFLGVYLTDLTFIELGNPDFLPERKVNGVIREIQRYQVTPYNWVTVEGLRSYLLKLGDDKPVTQEGAEGEILSLIIEPREEDDDDE